MEATPPPLVLPAQARWLFAGDSLVNPDDISAAKLSAPGLKSYLTEALRSRCGRTSDHFHSAEVTDFQLRDHEELLERLAESHSADAVVLTFGFHELMSTGESSLSFERLFHRCLNRFRESGARVIVNLPPRPVRVEEEHRVDYLIRLEALRACTHEANAWLVDHWSHWEEHAQPDWYLQQSRYPSSTGMCQIADLFAASVRACCSFESLQSARFD